MVILTLFFIAAVTSLIFLMRFFYWKYEGYEAADRSSQFQTKHIEYLR